MANISKKIEGVTALDLIDSPLEWQRKGLSFTASGYGKRIPTHYKLRYRGRLYRVYCCIYSNIGTIYITSKGVDLIID